MKLISKSSKRDGTQKNKKNGKPDIIQSQAVEIAYPETQWSEEQKRALKMATQPSTVDEPHITDETADQIFEHLAPPKKSILKIALLVLLILILVSAASFGGWYYWWTTYATFEYDLQPVVILNGQNTFPSAFLTDEAKTEGISATFQNSDFSPVPGRVTVPLKLEYGWRSLETTATLFVMIPVTQVIREFREEAPDIDPFELISNAEIARGIDIDIHFTEPHFPLDAYEVGEYDLNLSLNGAPFSVVLIIEDTTAPTATSVPVVINIGDPVDPDDFVTEINDASSIASVAFVNEPDVLSHREQLIEVIITDEYGNYSTFTSSLSIILNDEPPVITGISLIESMVGKEVEYGHGVEAFDSFVREIAFSVDDSEVDIDKEGEYTAYYIAHDLTGLVTSVPFTVLIISVDPADVIKQADDILEQILEEDMTDVEKIQAIFTHIRTLLTFEESDEKPLSIYEAAHHALDAKRGNSFNFSALAQVLLTRAEIPNMRIFRSSEHPSHVWNLVNPYNDSWYHFDSMPTSVRDINNLMYMFTAEQADEFAEKLAERDSDPMYYDFDAELYPEIVEKN